MAPPQHPYADLLAASVPELRPGWIDGLDEMRLAEARGEPAQAGVTDRCAFLGRCAARVPSLCHSTPPPLRHFAKGSVIRCHRTEEELFTLQSPERSGSATVVPLLRAISN
jgi:peptide/nickel transport system ATP-binding protein